MNNQFQYEENSSGDVDFGNQKIFLDEISPDTMCLIFEFLRFDDIWNISLVNREFNMISSSNRVWERFLKEFDYDETFKYSKSGEMMYSQSLRDQYVSFYKKFSFIRKNDALFGNIKSIKWLILLLVFLLVHVTVWMIHFLSSPMKNTKMIIMENGDFSDENIQKKFLHNLIFGLSFSPIAFLYYSLLIYNLFIVGKYQKIVMDMSDLFQKRSSKIKAVTGADGKQQLEFPLPPPPRWRNRKIEIKRAMSKCKIVKPFFFWNIILGFSCQFHFMTCIWLVSICLCGYYFPLVTWKISMIVPISIFVVFFISLEWLVWKCIYNRKPYHIPFFLPYFTSAFFIQFYLMYFVSSLQFSSFLEGEALNGFSFNGFFFFISFITTIAVVVLGFVLYRAKYEEDRTHERYDYSNYDRYRSYKNKRVSSNMVVFLFCFYIVWMVLCIGFVNFMGVISSDKVEIHEAKDLGDSEHVRSF